MSRGTIFLLGGINDVWVVGRAWRLVSYQFTDGAGRVLWLVPPGRYTVRASFSETSDLSAAVSRPLTVVGA